MAVIHGIVLVNNSGIDLYTAQITGYFAGIGSDLTLSQNQIIPNGQQATLGTFQTENGDQFGWVNLADSWNGAPMYQLFMQSPASGDSVQIMGFYNPDTTVNSGPSTTPLPFKDPTCWSVSINNTYLLQNEPPSWNYNHTIS
jgi:hypothetical protein